MKVLGYETVINDNDAYKQTKHPSLFEAEIRAKSVINLPKNAEYVDVVTYNIFRKRLYILVLCFSLGCL